MKPAIGAAAAGLLLGAATAASAACSVVTNHVVILNKGAFMEAGFAPLPLELKARWRVDGSESGFLPVPKDQAIERDYPGNYPLVVDLHYSDRLRGWHDGGSVPVYDRVTAQAEQACRAQKVTRLTAVTTILVTQANANGLTWGIDFEFPHGQ